MGQPAAVPQYVLYWRPLDYLQGWVLRRFLVFPGAFQPDRVLAWGPDLGPVLAQLPPGVDPLPLSPADEPQIMAVWM